jgi:hypothetical protein
MIRRVRDDCEVATPQEITARRDRGHSAATSRRENTIASEKRGLEILEI